MFQRSSFVSFVNVVWFSQESQSKHGIEPNYANENRIIVAVDSFVIEISSFVIGRAVKGKAGKVRLNSSGEREKRTFFQVLVALVRLYVGRDQLAPVFTLPRFYLSFALLFSSSLCIDIHERLLHSCTSSNSHLQHIANRGKTNRSERMLHSFIHEKIVRHHVSCSIAVEIAWLDFDFNGRD